MIKNNQNGRSMVELLGVLGILAVLAAGAISLISTVYGKYKISRVTQQIGELQKSVNKRYAALEGYTGLSVASAISDNLVPLDMVSNNKIYHKFAGLVELGPTLTGDIGAEIVFKDVPQIACVQLLSLNWVTADSSDLQAIQIGSTRYRWPSSVLVVGETTQDESELPADTDSEAESKFIVETVSINRSLPIDMGEALSRCKANNNISWTFY